MSDKQTITIKLEDFKHILELCTESEEHFTKSDTAWEGDVEWHYNEAHESVYLAKDKMLDILKLHENRGENNEQN